MPFHLSSADLMLLGRNETNDDSVPQLAPTIDRILSRIR